MLIRRIARPLLSVVFIGRGIDSLRRPEAAADAAAAAVRGLQALPTPVGSNIPSDPQTVAQINAAVQVGGGVLLAAGRMPRVASTALAFTVLVGNVGAHTFWSETDPQRKAEKRNDFLTDLSLLGALMIAAADTAGKPSLGWRSRRTAERLLDAVSSTLPELPQVHDTLESDLEESGEKLRHGLQVGADKATPLAEAARKRGHELAGTARARGEHLAESARHLAESANGHAVEDALERVGSKVRRRLR